MICCHCIFISTAAAVYFNSWLALFKFDENIADNKILLLQYLALQKEVRSYTVTNEVLNYGVSSSQQPFIVVGERLRR
jgi:hypothetical protein